MQDSLAAPGGAKQGLAGSICRVPAPAPSRRAGIAGHPSTSLLRLGNLLTRCFPGALAAGAVAGGKDEAHPQVQGSIPRSLHWTPSPRYPFFPKLPGTGTRVLPATREANTPTAPARC